MMGTRHILVARLRATLYACFLPCLIQLFFEKFQSFKGKLEILYEGFQKEIELDTAENRRIQ